TLNSVNVVGSSLPANGIYLPTTNTLGLSAGSFEIVAITSGAVTLQSGINMRLIGSSTGYVALASGNAGSSNFTATLPAHTGSIAELNLAQTWTAAQTIGSGDLLLSGATSGATTLNASATASGTLTLPAVTDTLAVLGTAQSFTALQTFNLSGASLPSGI